VPAVQELGYDPLAIPHWIDRVGLLPPVEVILPLPVAEVEVRAEAALVVTVGSATAVVKVVSPPKRLFPAELVA